MSTSGLALKLRRIEQDVKAKDLAEAAGKHPAWVSRIESRRIVPQGAATDYLTALASIAASRNVVEELTA